MLRPKVEREQPHQEPEAEQRMGTPGLTTAEQGA